MTRGVFYCLSGKPITDERVSKYENMCHERVRSFFPALALYEAASNYDDLIADCRREVFLAILDGFDPVKAMTSTHKDPAIRKEKEEAVTTRHLQSCHEVRCCIIIKPDQ